MPEYGYIANLKGSLFKSIRKAGRIGCDFIEIYIEPPLSSEYVVKNSKKIRKALDMEGIFCTVHMAYWAEMGTELEGIKAEKKTLAGELETILASASLPEAKVTALEQVIATRDSDIVTLKQTASESDVIASEAKQSLANAVSAYKKAAAQANPAIPAEIITGDTIEAVDQSLESAKALVDQVRQSLAAETAAGKVPAGAPARTPPDLSALSPREKIQYAVGEKKS